MLEIKPLQESNFHAFIALLELRGEAPEDYYRWKYLDQPASGRPTGFMAYWNDKPAGCIGIINRIFRTADGIEEPATWFADWFVLEEARGYGIGVKLMSKINDQAKVNFGIPGPEQAQKTALKANYKYKKGFYDFTFYLKPYRCGYYRFNAGPVKRILRGIKAKLSYRKNSLPHPDPLLVHGWSIGFPSAMEWMNCSEAGSKGSGALVRDIEWIKWISEMPVSVNGKRQWWVIHTASVWACGFVEYDYWGLRKSRILDLFSLDKKVSLNELLPCILTVLEKNGHDLASFAFMDNEFKGGAVSTKSILPLYENAEINTEFCYLSALDKESAWREFRMN